MYFKYFYLLNENYYLLIVIIIINLFEKVQPQFIRSVEFSKKEKNEYITMPKDLSVDLFEMGNSYSNIHIDFGKPQEQVIVIRDAISVKLKLSFQIYSPLSEIYESLKNEFCYKFSIALDSLCYEIPGKNTDMKWFNMNFSVKWLQNKTGYKLAIDPTDSYQHDLTGFYYFKSSTPVSGMILSNFLEIRDILFWERNMIKFSPVPTKKNYKESLSVLEIPINFSCLDQTVPLNLKDFPYWITLEFKNFVKWAWCPVSKQTNNMKEIGKTYVDDCLQNSISKCERKPYLCPHLSGRMYGWSETISFDGTLTLTSGKQFNDYGGTLDGYALMCYYQSLTGYHALKYISNEYDSSGKEFIKGLKWNSTVQNQKSEFKLISPINQTMRIGILKQGFILNAFYHSPPNYTYEWIRNDKTLFTSNKWVVTPYSLHYKSKIALEMEGFYYLRIKHLSQSYLFTFDLKVLSPPKLVKITNEPILSSAYLMVNSNFSISYLYKGNPTHANIYINGILYKPLVSDRKVFLHDLAQKSFNLKHLDFDFFQKQLPNGTTQFTYSVKNVLFPATLLRGQDHNIIIEVINEYGVSRSLLNIYVLKPPKFENLPKSDNCTTFCSSLQPHLFRCELDTDYYKTREVFVEKFWLINDIRLDSLTDYSLYFKDDTKGLNLMPVKSNNSELDLALRLLLKNAKLICRVRLLYPGSSGMTEAKLIHEKRIIYDTFSDPSVMNHFSAEIRLDWEPDIVNASYTWIIFLAIALLLIVMFIFLLVKFTLRGQGKSYQIEKLEIAKGYNRDEEIIENETIKPYLRSGANNANNRTNHFEKDSSKDLAYSPLNYSPSNGNGNFRPRDVLDIIDDEENAIDPNKFNEEGSFIGVYATKNNHSNLPPEIKINKF